MATETDQKTDFKLLKSCPHAYEQRAITNLEHKKNSPQETENDAWVCQIKLTDFN